MKRGKEKKIVQVNDAEAALAGKDDVAACWAYAGSANLIIYFDLDIAIKRRRLER